MIEESGWGPTNMESTPYTEEEKQRIKARHEAAPDVSTFQGIGTTYYGKRDKRKSDNSYVTTEWFVILFLPIVPLGSFRIVKIGTKSRSFLFSHSSTTSYKILEQIPLRKNIRQVLTTYLLVYGIIAAAIYLIFI